LINWGLRELGRFSRDQENSAVTMDQRTRTEAKKPYKTITLVSTTAMRKPTEGGGEGILSSKSIIIMQEEITQDRWLINGGHLIKPDIGPGRDQAKAAPIKPEYRQAICSNSDQWKKEFEMFKQRKAAVQDVQSRLFDAELAIDEAITKVAALTGFMPIARQNAKLSAVFGQDAIDHAGKSMTALIEARAEITATHNRLAETRDQMGLREMAMGSTDTKPPAVSPSSAEKREQIGLREVALGSGDMKPPAVSASSDENVVEIAA